MDSKDNRETFNVALTHDEELDALFHEREKKVMEDFAKQVVVDLTKIRSLEEEANEAAGARALEFILEISESEKPVQKQSVSQITKIINTTGSPGRLMDAWSLLLPRRIINEELGDYLELIHALQQRGASAWQIWLRTLSAIFWTGINAVGYALKALGKTKSAG